jgi:hypothetical protein
MMRRVQNAAQDTSLGLPRLRSASSNFRIHEQVNFRGSHREWLHSKRASHCSMLDSKFGVGPLELLRKYIIVYAEWCDMQITWRTLRILAMKQVVFR